MVILLARKVLILTNSSMVHYAEIQKSLHRETTLEEDEYISNILDRTKLSRVHKLKFNLQVYSLFSYISWIEVKESIFMLLIKLHKLITDFFLLKMRLSNIMPRFLNA